MSALEERFHIENMEIEVSLEGISRQADCIARDRQTNKRYVVEIKTGTSVDSFLQTTLYRSFVQLRAMAREKDAKPMLVYVPDAISEKEVDRITSRVQAFTPELSLVILDADRNEIIFSLLNGKKDSKNFESWVDSEEEKFIGEESNPLRFSDKELWLFKCWFYSRSGFQKLWDHQFESVENGNQLSDVSGVSLSECYRWVNAMEKQGYLREEGHGKKTFSRFREYLERWNERYRIRDNKAFSTMVIPELKGNEDALEFLTEKLKALPEQKRRDYVLTGMRGASLYGKQFVNISNLHLYRSHDNPQRMNNELGLYKSEESVEVEIVTFKPKFEKSVFEAANKRNGLFVVDPLQLYLDCYHVKKRGLEQAEIIRDEMLMPQSTMGLKS